jgi:ABC-2 type transport system ATP-binding protein
VTAALSTRGLTKTYGGVPAVDALDLSVEPGTLYGFLGPNGAGKTTTIRMLLGLIHPTGGEVEVLGEPVTRGRGVAALRRVGALVEEPAFWRYLSGRRNLEYFARAAGPPDDRRARLGRIDDVLATVELGGAAGKKVRAYSQGMRQRLGIARALLGAPDVLILDEPTNGLDPQGIAEMRTLFRRLADGGTTVFVSSHLLAEVEAMCDVVGVLARGRLLAEGPPSNLRPSGTRLRIAVDDPERARKVLADVDGVSVDGAAGDGNLPAGPLRVRLAPPASAAATNATLVAAGVAVSELTPEHERLEDVFLDLVGGPDGEGATAERSTRRGGDRHVPG